MNVELRWVDLHLVGPDLDNSSDWGSVLYMDGKKTTLVQTSKNACYSSTLAHAKTFTKQRGTHRVVCVVREELHLKHLFLLSGSTQKGREEQQRFQELQQVGVVSQHALTTAGQHTLTHISSQKYDATSPQYVSLLHNSMRGLCARFNEH